MSKNAFLLLPVLAIMTGFLSSCQESFPDDPDLPAAVTTRAQTSSWEDGIFPGETFSVINEDDITQETAFADDPFSDGDENEEREHSDRSDFPVVTPASGMYDVYPMKIIYPEKQSRTVTVTIETAQEDVYTDDGKLAAEFSAEYPLISGIDENVCQKINNEIKLFIDNTLDEFREMSDNTETFYYEPTHNTWKINMEGVDFAGDGYDINGNIFTVYFADNRYQSPANHGSETPTPMIFDLRTGDRVYFSELIWDNDGLAAVLEDWFSYYLFAYGGVPSGMLDADEYVDILKNRNEGAGSDLFGMDDSGVFRVAGNDANERMTVCNGCMGFYLAAYEYGSFADGVRRVDIPASEIFPYLNEKGKTLFEGYVSAESVPANVIIYKGGKYFDTTMWVPNIMNETDPTDGDVKFVSLFENAWRNYNKLHGGEG